MSRKRSRSRAAQETLIARQLAHPLPMPAHRYPPVRQPQVLVTLSPAGELVAELTGGNGSRRQIELGWGAEAAGALVRILQAQMAAPPAQAPSIGEVGSPTKQQVWHWNEHERKDKWIATCPFCQAEAPEAPAKPLRPIHGEQVWTPDDLGI